MQCTGHGGGPQQAHDQLQGGLQLPRPINRPASRSTRQPAQARPLRPLRLCTHSFLPLLAAGAPLGCTSTRKMHEQPEKCRQSTSSRPDWTWLKCLLAWHHVQANTSHQNSECPSIHICSRLHHHHQPPCQPARQCSSPQPQPWPASPPSSLWPSWLVPPWLAGRPPLSMRRLRECLN